MKKVLFASAAALCTAIGLSSFTTSKSSFATYYFVIDPGEEANTSFLNDQVTYRGTSPGSDCPGAGKRCVVSFSESQVTGIGVNTILKTNGTPQLRQATIYTKS